MDEQKTIYPCPICQESNTTNATIVCTDCSQSDIVWG